MMKKIKLILVDDHEIFLAGLKLKLASFSDIFEIIGEAANCEQMLLLLEKELIPDLILMDYHLPGKDGISICRQLKDNEKYKCIKIIILSAYSSNFLNVHNYDIIREAIDTGIEGYLLKDSKIEEIVSAIMEVMNGETFVLGETINLKEINKEIIGDRRRLNIFLRRQNNYSLTNKEIEILDLFSQGYSAKAAANILSISEECVTNHKDNIKQKLKEKFGLDFKNVVELIVWAIKNKLIKV